MHDFEAVQLRLMPSVLFVCVANSCRSQMAEAMANAASHGAWDVWSAGSHPTGRVHPLAIQLMDEVGLNVRTHRSKGLQELPQQRWDYVVTMGCGDACPSIPAARRLDWALPDPVGMPIAEARAVRDQIMMRVRALLA
ncbi:MAG: arsenate reductase ArsC [Candidatus Omnitrophota bacterium]|nr:arsenate reductase ArsC [Candidatus Omnitrophota bacterium]